jgi:hypothetical protein
MKAGEKQALSQPIIASTISNNVTGRSDSNMPDNFQLFLSEATPSTPPDVALHSRKPQVVITKNTHSLCMSSSLWTLPIFATLSDVGQLCQEKNLGKIGNLAKICIFWTFTTYGNVCLFVKKLTKERILAGKMRRGWFLPLLRYPRGDIIVAGKVGFAIKKARQFFTLPRFNY